MLRRLGEDQKRSAKIRGDHVVEHGDIAIGDRAQRHDAGAMDDDIDRADALSGLLEELLHIGGAGDIRLESGSPSTSGGDRRDGLFRFRGVAGVVEHYGEAVAR